MKKDYMRRGMGCSTQEESILEMSSSVQSLSHVWLFVTPRTAAHQASCPSPTPGACWNSCPSSRWCHPTASPYVVPFSSRSHSFPASGSFLMSRLFASGGLSIGASAFSPYLFRLQIFLSAILIPACALSSLAFCLMYSAYKLNKQGDNIQPWCTPFPIWNQSIVPGLVLTIASWPACRFLRRQVRWSGIPISWKIFQFVVIHTVKGFGIVNKAGVNVFLELFCFFDDPVDVVNLISGFFAFYKSSLNIWKFSLHLLLKPGLENFEHYFTSVWDEYNSAVVWTFFGTAFLWDWNENWPFPVLWPLLSFLYLLAYWVQHFHSIIF